MQRYAVTFACDQPDDVVGVLTFEVRAVSFSAAEDVARLELSQVIQPVLAPLFPMTAIQKLEA